MLSYPPELCGNAADETINAAIVAKEKFTPNMKLHKNSATNAPPTAYEIIFILLSATDLGRVRVSVASRILPPSSG